jgi:TfoX/Sxy family transcriptional regulator of competence genes
VAYDEQLAERIRSALNHRRGISERKMFGGVAFLLRGNMFCGIVGRDLMVRVGPVEYEAALGRAHVREMDFTGRPLSGMVYVRPPGFRSAQQLKSWVDRGLDFARSLPAK